MSSVLSRRTEESRDLEQGSTERSADRARDPLVRVVEVALGDDESGRSTGSQGKGIVRPFLLVDLRAAVDYLRGNRGGPTEAIGRGAEEVLQTATSEGELERGRSSRRGRTSGQTDGGGRGMLSKLFLVGLVVGLGYVMRKRSGSVGEAVSEATDRAREVADETEMRSGEMAQRTESVADEAADRIEEQGETVADEAADQVREVGETAADSVQESGEMAADEIEEVADTAEEAEQQAEEKVDEVSGDEENEQ